MRATPDPGASTSGVSRRCEPGSPEWTSMLPLSLRCWGRRSQWSLRHSKQTFVLIEGRGCRVQGGVDGVPASVGELRAGSVRAGRTNRELV